MRSVLETSFVLSAVLLSTLLSANAQPTITRDPCGNSVCLSVPGVTPTPPGGSILSSQDFNSSDGGCTVINNNAPLDGPWTYNNGAGTWSTAGQEPELGRAPSTRLTCPPVTLTQAGNVLVTFNHRYSFEYDGTAWDGGLVQVSVNGGVFVTIPAQAFLQNAYNGTVGGNSAAEIHGQAAFINVSAGYATKAFITSIADLGCLSAGDTVSVRFLASFDSNTRNGNPAWEIDSLGVIQGAGNGSVAELLVSALPPTAGGSLSFQWQKSTGGGPFADISGATSGFLAFAPALVDNGACYRAIVSASSGSVTSAVACLTVIQPNTPPRFTCGPNQTVSEDSGPQTVPGWATSIVAHSLPPLDTVVKFNTQPPNSQLFGVATLSGGVLHLTDAGQAGAFGDLSLNLPATNVFQTFSASWKSLLGGGGGGGADGYSFNVGDNLPYPPSDRNPDEEGAASGLAVTVDTWDNGSGDVVGIEIRWQGTALASASIPKDDPGTGVFLRKSIFVNASVTVDASGLATFNYDGTVISAQLPGYTGISANRLLFAGRTGGANDNQWIDDLTGSSSWIANFLSPADNPALAEQGQTVGFLVSNDNPSLFTAQPAISPNGTLTYTPAPNACGLANLTVVARDNGGTNSLCGGNDTSASCQFTITVSCLNDCPTANPQTVSVASGGTANFQLTGSDPDGNTLGFQVTQPPVHGTLVLQINTGVASYTPAPGYTGPDSFRFIVSDSVCQSPPATVTINVGTQNQPPTARITAAPLADFSPFLPNPVLIAANGFDACLSLDGSASSDPESGTNGLSYAWFLQPSPTPFATGVTATNCLRRGTHTLVLAVTDSQGATGTGSLTVDVLNPCEAEGGLILLIQNSGLPRNVQQPLVSSVKAACAAYEKFGARLGVNQLETFQNKVRVQVSDIDPGLADQMIDAAQAIIDAINALDLR